MLYIEISSKMSDSVSKVDRQRRQKARGGDSVPGSSAVIAYNNMVSLTSAYFPDSQLEVHFVFSCDHTSL